MRAKNNGVHAITQAFIDSIMTVTTAKEILVTFDGGCKAKYTMAIFHDIITDPQVIEVMDTYTGEILYCK